MPLYAVPPPAIQPSAKDVLLGWFICDDFLSHNGYPCEGCLIDAEFIDANYL